MIENQEYAKYRIFQNLNHEQIGHFEKVIDKKNFPSGDVIRYTFCLKVR